MEQELPMGPVDCTLDFAGLRDQLARYRRLGATAQSIEQRELELVISFTAL